MSYYPKFFKPYLKINLHHINFPTHLSYKFQKSYDNLPIDPYVHNKTRYRRYANYDVKLINKYNPNFIIKYNNKNIFQQNVNDNRQNKRQFKLIENPCDPFLIEYIRYISKILNSHESFKKLNIDIHQVRQITYPGIDSHNSPEGIHQDGAHYVVPALVFKRFNIRGGLSYIYDEDKKEINKELLNKYEFTLFNDTKLYHYVSPIKYYESDCFEQYGFRDILGLDIHIVE
jgi:hypothetical protein